MVRGRRARAVNTAFLASNVQGNYNDAINGTHFDDQYCASPKRKDCKIDEDIRKVSKANACKKSSKSIENARTKTRSQTIKNFFKVNSPPAVINAYPLDYNVNERSEDDGSTYSDDISDECYVHREDMGLPQPSENIFLQEPVLSLDVDKSPNQASSIVINKSIPMEHVFSPTSNYNVNLNGQFDKIVTLNGSPIRDSEGLNIDSNSCDSGVVLDPKIEQSPSRRRKPNTPHRIVCPSPIKQPSVAHTLSAIAPTALSPLLKNSNTAKTATSGYLNVIQKRHPKSRRRLNSPQHENETSTVVQPLVSGATPNEAVENMNNANNNNVSNLNINQKSILNSAKNPSAEQNTNNNFKISQQKPTLINESLTKPKTTHRAGGNHELTDFFPVRRSVRKTKTAVKEEMMRTLEKAIINEVCDGLKVQHFEGKGRGIVADRLFKRGEFVVEYVGDLIDMNEANMREKQYALDENTGCYMYYFKHKNVQYCIDATAESGKLGRLVNHSRNGNLMTKVVVVKNRPHLVLIAKDEIQPNEELTYDYGDRSKEALQHHPWLAL